MKCSRCGTDNPGDANFCTGCGSSLSASNKEITQSDSRNYVSCPRCKSRMVRHTARRGRWAGQDFYGCSTFKETGCKGILNLDEIAKSNHPNSKKVKPVNRISKQNEKVPLINHQKPSTPFNPTQRDKGIAQDKLGSLPPRKLTSEPVPATESDTEEQADFGVVRRIISDVRRSLIDNAVKKWVDQLMDKTGGNRLIFYRHLKVGTLDLSSTPESALASLFKNRKVKLSEFFPKSFHYPDDVKKGRSVSYKARTIADKGRSNFEEKGLQTLYLAFGMATWNIEDHQDVPRPPPNAPVLLQRLDITQKGVGAGNYELSLLDDPEINPTLVHYLNKELQCNPNCQDIADNPPASLDQRNSVLRDFEEACSAIPGFKINKSIVVGNFSYANLPIVKDLEDNGDEIANDVLLSAIAGDEDAKNELRNSQLSLNLGDLKPVPDPKDEFLVLDADSSQSWVIQAGIKGAHLVVQGPPGTGKSQTIANLIASASARGKSILFVAQKRAAIDAVVKRLDAVGLGDLILDLHARSSNKRRISETLNKAITSAGEVLEPEVEPLQEELNVSTSILTEYKTALHKPDETWRTSIYESMCRLIESKDGPNIAFSLNQQALKTLPYDQFTTVKEYLKAFADGAGFSILRESNSLKGLIFSRESLRQKNNVEKALDLIDLLDKEIFPDAIKNLSEVCNHFSFKFPSQLFEANNLTSMLQASNALSDESTAYIYELDLRSICEDLSPSQGIERYFLWLISPSRELKYKSAVRQISSCVFDQTLSSQHLFTLATEAKRLKDEWTTLGKSPSTWDHTNSLEQSLNKLHESLGNLGSLLGVESLINNDETSFDLLRETIAELVDQKQELMNFPDLHLKYDFLKRKGLERFIELASHDQLSSEKSVDALELIWLSKVHEVLVHRENSVSSFSRKAHDNIVERFRSADASHIKSGPEKVKRAWAEKSVASRNKNPYESSIVTKESKLKRGHKTVRELFDGAEHVVTSIKPCWVMSPLVVSEMLPARKCFDLVIFDEASQIPPANAATVLLRGRQAVVAGDSKQLPPTAFFTSGFTDDDDDDDEGFLSTSPDQDKEKFDKSFAKGQSISLVTGLESLLDQMSALLPAPIGEKSLNWHYRSKNERLIAFSNAHPDLYNSRLTTFPGLNEENCINYVQVIPSSPITQVAATSEDEATRVIDLILDHIKQAPEQSLGVITFGSPHEKKIKDKWFVTLQKHSEAREFVEKHDENEPLFIKNIERVQGDERDAIILTTGYTKTPDGRMRYQFGPITTEGGYRRLNVAITRAKEKVTLVSSFSSADMQDSELKSTGPKMLKQYLAYAESRGIKLDSRTKKKPEMNPFEWDVYDSLKAKGLNLVPQYGSSGRWIDFAVMHPKFPGLPILAIETDGASYHSSETSRDSDRLRQSQLEAQGWTFHRIWSTSWFREKENEIELALDAAKLAQSDYDNPVHKYESVPNHVAEAETDQVDTEQSRTSFPAEIIPNLPLNNYTTNKLVQVVMWVNSDGRLRTDDQLVTETARAIGRMKIKQGLRTQIMQALKVYRKKSGGVGKEITTTERGELWWIQYPTIDEYTTLELIDIIDWIESDGLPRTEDEVVRETTKVLGFARRGRRIDQALHEAINQRKSPEN